MNTDRRASRTPLCMRSAILLTDKWWLLLVLLLALLPVLLLKLLPKPLQQLPALLLALWAPEPVAPLLVLLLVLLPALLPALLLVLLRTLRAPKPLAPLHDKVPLPASCWGSRRRFQDRWGRCRHC